MKIKKYTIDEEIPKGLQSCGNSIEKELVGGGRFQNPTQIEVRYFYFLVEEESEDPTHILFKCPKCSLDTNIKI